MVTFGLGEVSLTTFPFAQRGFTQVWLSLWSNFTRDPVINLREEGCWLQDGSRNCSAMCADSDSIWGPSDSMLNVSAMANLANCFRYAGISNFLELASKDDSIVLENATIASEYGILKASDVDLSAINASTSRCLVDYCSTSNRCSGQLWADVDFGPFTLRLPNYPTVCKGMESFVNPDMVGNGVLSAYFLALSFLLIGYLSVRLSSISKKRLIAPFQHLGKRQAGGTGLVDKNDRAPAGSSPRLGAVVSFLAEFQRAQCVFWLTLDIAVLVALYRPVQTLAMPNMAAWYLNITAIKTITLLASVSINFGLYCLHIANQRSWYIFSLSTITLVLSWVAYFATFVVIPETLVLDQDAYSVPSCGGFSITSYCDDLITIYHATFQRWLNMGLLNYGLIVFTAMGNTGLFLDIFFRDTARGQRTQNRTRARLEREQRLIKAWHITYRSLQFCAEFVFIFIWIYFVVGFIIIYTSHGGGNVARTWSFGQIIALTIWAPLILEWVYAMFNGLEKASAYRVAHPYRLIQTGSTHKARDSNDYDRYGSAQQYHRTAVTELDEMPDFTTDIDRISAAAAYSTVAMEPETSKGQRQHGVARLNLLHRKPIASTSITRVDSTDSVIR